MSSNLITSQHFEPRGEGGAIPPATGILISDGAGGYTLASTGTATGKLISDGAGGLAIAAIGNAAAAAGTLVRFGTSYIPVML